MNRTRFTYIFSSFVLILICFASFAQNVTVYNLSESKTIAEVYVYNQSKNITATTNNLGIVDISDFSASDFIYFQHASFETEKYNKAEIEALGFQIFLRSKSINLEEFIITASKSKEKISEVSNQIEVITAKSIKLQNPQTTANLLNNNGKVYVQKSQMGGGSPVIRGFEANKVLLVLDGVRMNNAIYRSGHVQNVISIDPSILERTEVIFGPASLIYGSDALGGVMHFITKDPILNKNGISNINTMFRTASANNEKSAHLDFNLGFKNIGVLTSLSFSDFGDLTIGKNRKHGDDNWGKRYFYVGEDEDNVDVMMKNSDENVLVETGYHQIDLLQKWKFKIAENQSLVANFQYSTTSNVPRYDRLNDYSEVPTNISRGQLKFAEWNYGPQNRFLASLKHKLTSNNNSFYDNINSVIAFQKIDEDRINRKYGSDDFTIKEEDVQVYSLNVDVVKNINNKNTFYYGLESNYNNVNSNAFLQSKRTGLISDEFVLSRYADNGSNMFTNAVYLKHKIVFNESLNLTDGLRFTNIGLNSNYSQNFNILPVKNFTGNYSAITGGFGLNYKITKATKISFNAGTGFRAPNIDDTGKFFDPQDEQVVVPNFEIKPEYLWNIDFGFQHKIMQKATINVNAFYNYIFNAIVRRPFLLNGQDSLVFEGTNSAIFANQNAGKAQVYGVSAGLKVKFSNHISAFGSYNYIKGKDLSENVPLGHIPPIFGTAGINFENKKLQSRLFLQYNATKIEDEYSPAGEDKENEALATAVDAEGSVLAFETPKWMTTNFNIAYQLDRNFTVSGSVENIFDIHYIPFASGISGSGRNFVLALRWSI